VLLADEGYLVAAVDDQVQFRQHGLAVFHLGQAPGGQDVVAGVPVRLEADPREAPARRLEVLDLQLVQHLAPARRLPALRGVRREALDEFLQVLDLVLAAFLEVLELGLEHPAHLEPEVIVARILSNESKIDIAYLGADGVQEVPVVGHYYDDVLEIHEEILEPGDAVQVEAVGGFVEQENVGGSEKRLGKQGADLEAFGNLSHEPSVVRFGNAESGQQDGSLGLGFPAAYFSELAFEHAGADAVGLAEIFLGVDGFAFLHDGV
jgi:hypothetical protein